MFKTYEPTEVWYHPKQDEIVIVSHHITKDEISNMELLSVYVATYWHEYVEIIPFWILKDEFVYVGEF